MGGACIGQSGGSGASASQVTTSLKPPESGGPKPRNLWFSTGPLRIDVILALVRLFDTLPMTRYVRPCTRGHEPLHCCCIQVIDPAPPTSPCAAPAAERP